MISVRGLTLAAALLGALNAPARAETVVGYWSGERSTTTPEFEVRGPWLLDWRTTGEYSRVIGVDVSLFNAGTGMHEGVVLRTKEPGNGVRLFQQSGEFYFRVDATLMGWHLKVIQLTEEEAALYTPRSNHPLDQ